MKKQGKIRILIYLGAAALAMGVLAAGLPQLQLLPGHPLPPAGPGDPTAPYEGPAWAETLVAIFDTLLIASIPILAVVIIYAIASPKLRKRLLTSLLYIIPALIVLFFLTQVQPAAIPEMEEEEPTPEGLPAATVEAMPGPEFDSAPSQWLILVASAGLALVVTTLLAGIAWFFWRMRQRSDSALEQVAQQAEEAIEAIRAGADLRDTVLRCYYEMGQVVRQQRGIQRPHAMTPREFERYLGQAGLPIAEVRRLTRLFEKVRYGAKIADEEEESQAVDCLTAIAAFCRSAR